jgi:hypothetical protein
MSETPRPIRAERLTLAALPTAISCAELFVSYELQRWNLPPEHIERAVSLAVELVSNAVETTGITEWHPLYSEVYDSLKLLRVRLLLFARSLVIEVWDSSPQPPIPPDANVRWNYYVPPAGGKVVWVELPFAAQRAVHDTAELPPVLPKRRPSTRPPRPIAVMDDPNILRQVLEGLQALGREDEQEG